MENLEPLSFENTQVAFAGKTDTDLRRAFFLFRFLGKKSLVDAGKFFTQVAFACRLPISPLIKMTLFKQFVGGETIEACENTIAKLWQYGIGTILDYSAEGQETEIGFEKTTHEILRSIQFAKGDPRIPFAVFKPSGLASTLLLEKQSLGEKLSPEESEAYQRFKARIHLICKQAKAAETPVLIDAEESWTQAAIDALALEMMREFNHEKIWVYNTVQMYRHDRLQYIQDLAQQAQSEGFKLGFKLVRGAYMEKERARAVEKGYPDPIQPNKAATDRDFDAAVVFCLSQVENIALCSGSHNESSNLKLIQEMQVRGLVPNHPHIYFAQLLGMSDHLSYNLARHGYNVVKYVPYAPVKEIVPYLIRRAEENTSVAGQSSRELSLIRQELERRRQALA